MPYTVRPRPSEGGGPFSLTPACQWSRERAEEAVRGALPLTTGKEEKRA